MVEADETEELDPDDDAPAGEWLTASQLRKKHGVRMTALKALVDAGKVRTKGTTHNVRYAEADITDVVDSTKEPEFPDEPGAQAIAAATEGMRQAQQNSMKLFNMVFDRADKLLERMQTNLDKTHERLEKAESTNQQMRETHESTKTEQHLRELATQESTKRQTMQKQAWEAVQGFGLPFLAKKFGFNIPMPGMPPASNAPPSPEKQEKVSGIPLEVKGQIADTFLMWVNSLTAEKLAALKETEPDYYEMITQLRAMMGSQ